MSLSSRISPVAVLLLLLPAWNVLAQNSDQPAEEAGIRYEILGNPVVGQPVAINLFIATAASNAIVLDYRIMDTSSLSFPESQALQVEVRPDPNGAVARQQVTVVPQREGRLFLNVSGTLQGDSGPVIRAAAIPIQVSAAPPGSTPETAVADDDAEATDQG